MSTATDPMQIKSLLLGLLIVFHTFRSGHVTHGAHWETVEDLVDKINYVLRTAEIPFKYKFNRGPDKYEFYVSLEDAEEIDYVK